MLNKLIDKAKALFARMIARFGGLHVFAANEDGEAEYVVVHNKREAYDLLREQWIKVSERLPKEDWVSDDKLRYGKDTGETVTHWMLLPEPPKVLNEGNKEA